MRLYLDDDVASQHLARALEKAGHEVLLPAALGQSGSADAVHLRQAVRETCVLLSRNRGDFEDLHELVVQVQGHHPGILIVCQDNDPKRDMKPGDIVRAINNLEAAGFSLADQFLILNHWR